MVLESTTVPCHTRIRAWLEQRIIETAPSIIHDPWYATACAMHVAVRCDGFCADDEMAARAWSVGALAEPLSVPDAEVRT